MVEVGGADAGGITVAYEGESLAVGHLETDSLCMTMSPAFIDLVELAERPGWAISGAPAVPVGR